MEISKTSIRNFAFFGIVLVFQLRNQLMNSNYRLLIEKYQSLFIVIAFTLLIVGWWASGSLSRKRFLQAFFILAVSMSAFMCGKELIQVELIFLFLASEIQFDKSIKHIAKYYILGTAVSCFFVFVSAKIGIIEEGTIGERFCGGFKNPNSFGFYIFYLTVCVLCFLLRQFKITFVVSFLVISILCFRYCRSRTSFILSILFIILYIIDRHSGIIKRIIHNSYLTRYYLKHAFLINTIVTLVWAKNYTAPVLRNTNILLSGRPYMWNRYVTTYSSSIFGLSGGELLFGPLDNAYLFVLVSYGFVGIIIYDCIFSFAFDKVIVEENGLVTIAYVVFILYMFFEIVPNSPAYNFFVQYAFTSFWMQNKKAIPQNSNVKLHQTRV